MKPKKTMEDEINEFLQIWSVDDFMKFIEEIADVFSVYYMQDNEFDTFKGKAEEEIANLRVIKTVYLISRIAELYAGKLCITKMKLPRLYERMEQITKECNNDD